MVKSGPGIITPDLWIGGILGRTAYRVVFADEATDVAAIESVEKPCFMYAKVSVDDYDAIELLSGAGFALVETAVTLSRPVDTDADISRPESIRFADAADEQGTVAVGFHNIIYSRFHTDRRIPNETANRLKGEWVRNFFVGKRGDHMVVAEVEGKIAGFCQILTPGDGRIIIDLIAVDSNHRRQNIASDMICFAETNLPGHDTIVVGTQIANVPSLRLYEKSGFRIDHANYVFHYHGD